MATVETANIESPICIEEMWMGLLNTGFEDLFYWAKTTAKSYRKSFY
ncbi:MAG: hypothetical protein AB8B69_21675 [Chitinophagales bacterium]